MNSQKSNVVKALVFKELGNPVKVMKPIEYELKEIEPDQIRVEFIACSLNVSDLGQIVGYYPKKPVINKDNKLNEQFYVGGNEAVAKVLDVGKNVKGIEINDLVVMQQFCTGTFRTQANIDPKGVIKLSKKVHKLKLIELATIMMNPSTAYDLLTEFVQLKEGDFVVQNGANSFVGKMFIMMGKIMKVKTINIIRYRDDNDELKNKLLKLGAHKVFYDNEHDKLKEYCNNLEVKLGLNSIGGGQTFKNLLDSISKNGTIVTYGTLKEEIEIKASGLVFKNIKMLGYWYNDRPYEHFKRTSEKIQEWYEQGLLSLDDDMFNIINFDQFFANFEQTCKDVGLDLDNIPKFKKKWIITFKD